MRVGLGRAVLAVTCLVAVMVVGGGAPAFADGGTSGSGQAGGVLAGLTTGATHTCAIRADGTVACWGPNTNGQATPPGGTFIALAAGQAHTCGVRSDGTLACWGVNTFAQATPPAGTYRRVAAGRENACAITTTGQVSCWGRNDLGQSSPPVVAAVEIASGDQFGCVLRTDSGVQCWGSNALGQRAVPGGAYRAIAAGTFHACAIRVDGTVACWGDNSGGQATPPAGTFVSLAAGDLHTCGVTTVGSVQCWGTNTAGQSAPPAGTFLTVSAGAANSCGVRVDGSLACWGANGAGQSTPPNGLFAHRALTLGNDVGCATGPTVCWGRSTAYSTLPTGTQPSRISAGAAACTVEAGVLACHDPGDVAEPTGTFVDVAAVARPGGQQAGGACGIRGDGTLACGFGTSAELQAVPTGTFRTLAVAADLQFFEYGCAIRTDSVLKCWGKPGATPILSPPAGSYLDVDVAASVGCAVRLDGALACWGEGASHVLQGIPTGQFRSVDIGHHRACAVRVDGTLACWGDSTESPPSGTFVAVEVDDASWCGVRTDNQVLCWGGTGASTPTAPQTYSFAGPVTTAVQVAAPLAAPGSPAAPILVTSGSLPPGLSISAAGVLSGVPTAAGTYGFSLSMTNFMGTATGSYSVVVDRLRADPSDVTVIERDSGTRNATMSITLDQAPSVGVSLPYVTEDRTARAPGDYTSVSGSVGFAAGQTTAAITVPIRGDLVVESTEVLVVHLLSGSAVVPVADGRIAIIDDDVRPLPTVTIEAPANVVEGTTTGTTKTSARVTVRLSEAVDVPVTVSLSTVDGTAGSPSDFTALAATSVTIPAGSTRAAVTVRVKQDQVDEPDEAFDIQIVGADGATVGDPSTATVTILDDDAPPSVSVEGPASVVEGTGTGTTTATVTVRSSAPVAIDSVVLLSTANGSATAPADYGARTNREAIILAGHSTATFKVNIVRDSLDESNETLDVRITDTSGLALGSPSQVTITIVDDD